jgi:hypothetical protein
MSDTELGLEKAREKKLAAEEQKRGTLLRMPPALPTTLEDWISHLKDRPSINDLVEDVHKMLIGGEDSKRYIAFLSAVYDEQAVEGSLAADNIEAARMIREKANTIDGHVLQGEKLATISKSLGVVLRRYHFSRKERRQMVDGQIVPDNNAD